MLGTELPRTFAGKAPSCTLKWIGIKKADPRTYRFGSGVPWSHMISSCGSSVNACNVTGTIFGTHLLLYHAVFCIRHVTYTNPPLCSEGFSLQTQLLYYTTFTLTRTRYRLSTRYATTLVARPHATETFLCMLCALKTINWPYLISLEHPWGQHNTWKTHHRSYVICGYVHVPAAYDPSNGAPYNATYRMSHCPRSSPTWRYASGDLFVTVSWNVVMFYILQYCWVSDGSDIVEDCNYMTIC